MPFVWYLVPDLMCRLKPFTCFTKCICRLRWRLRMIVFTQKFPRNEQLVAENQSTYLIDLAKACYCLGIVYACTNCPELANEEFCRSRDLFEQDSKIHRFIKFRWGRSIRTWSFKYVCSFLHNIRLKQPINVSTLRCIAYSSTFSTISIIKCYTSKRKATYPIWHRKTSSFSRAISTLPIWTSLAIFSLCSTSRRTNYMSSTTHHLKVVGL